MNTSKIFIIIGVCVVAILAAWSIWALVFQTGPSTSSIGSTGTTLPIASSTTVVQPPPPVPVRVQQVSSPQNVQVASAFEAQIKKPNDFMLGGSIIALPYALQIWGDENVGGEALLQDSSNGWTLLNLGGGEWTVPDLVEYGVSTTTAQQLVAGLD